LRNLITIMLALALAAAAALQAGPVDDRSLVAERVMRLTRASAWTAAGSVPIAFDTHCASCHLKDRVLTLNGTDALSGV
jgi:ABC-type enterobactin transport system permease subunit